MTICALSRGFLHGCKFVHFAPLTAARGRGAAEALCELFLKKGLISRGKYGIICFCIKGILCPEVNFEQEVKLMPNIKSSKKDVISSKIAYEKNKANKSELKTIVKKFDAALVSGDKAVADAAYKAAVKAVDQAVVKGILHKNNAARKKSSMTLKMNKLA